MRDSVPSARYSPFVMYCVNGKPHSSLLIESTDSMMGSVSEVSKFFEHGKRQDKFTEVIDHEFSDVKKKRIKSVCRTRWVERHDALEVCVELYPVIVQSLHDITHGEDSVSWNRDTIIDVKNLLAAIEKGFFY